MTEQERTPSFFQQPETLAYDEEGQKWRCLGLYLSTEAAHREARSGYALHRKKPTAKRERDCRRLIQRYPELGAAASIIQELSAEEAKIDGEEQTGDEILIEDRSGSADGFAAEASREVDANGRESGPGWNVPQNLVFEEIAKPVEIVKDLHPATVDMRSLLEESDSSLLRTISQTLYVWCSIECSQELTM